MLGCAGNEKIDAIIGSYKDNDLTIDIKRIQRHVKKKHNQWFGYFEENQLSSVFQPIFSLAHQRIVGYEALLRVLDSTGKLESPVNLFHNTKEETPLAILDRLSRFLHIKRFPVMKDDVNWLFLNVSPGVIVNGYRYGSYFEDLLEMTNFPAHRVVIEIVEHPTTDPVQLQETVDFYISLGCLIAIDDFGAGQSNFERIWTLKPDIVKLDRSMIVHASQEDSIRQLLPGIVSLIHQTGALVLIEGIETQDQAMIALESDADFVQGYYFSTPVIDSGKIKKSDRLFEQLFKKHKTATTLKTVSNQNFVFHYKEKFMKSIEAITSGSDITSVCHELFLDPTIARAFVLTQDGIQIGETMHSQQALKKTDERFRPIRSAENADWTRRHYLQRAILHPNQLQITRPYLSITGAHSCITLSMMFHTKAGNRVLCCDIISDQFLTHAN